MNQDTLSKNIGIAISRHRRMKLYTQRELAKVLCMSRTTLSSYENGIRPIPVYTLYKISRLLDVDMMQFVNYNSTPNTTNL